MVPFSMTADITDNMQVVLFPWSVQDLQAESFQRQNTKNPKRKTNHLLLPSSLK